MPASIIGAPWELPDADGRLQPAGNPRLVVPPSWRQFVSLWAACRGESGIAHWPDAGGVGDQAAWIVDAFATLASIDAGWREEERQAKGSG